MISSLLGGLTEKTLMGVCGVLVILIIAIGVYHWFYTGILERKISTQQETIATLISQVTTIRQVNVKLSESLMAQNEGILKATKAQEEATRQAEQAIREVQAENKVLRKKYEAVLSAPRASDDDCKELSVRFREYFSIRLEEMRP